MRGWGLTGRDVEGWRLLEAEIEGKSERAIAIIAAALLEQRLTDFLASNTPDDDGMWKSRSHSSGPFGSFAVKIDLAFMCGLITRPARRDLIAIKDVRNIFAHNFKIKDFSDQSVKAKVMALRLLEFHLIELLPNTLCPAREPPIREEVVEMNTIASEAFKEELAHPVSRFVDACLLFSIALDGKRVSRFPAI